MKTPTSPSDSPEAGGSQLATLDVLAILAVPAFVLALTHLLIAERSVHGESHWLSLSPDTYEYVRMVRGGSANPPFAYRWLVPLLASLLPLSPLQALYAITQVSVVLANALLLWVLRALLHFRLSAACLSVIAFMTSTRSLLLVQNPFLVDGFSLLMMTLMLAALLADKPGRFALAAVTGVASREDCLFGAVGFLAARRRLGGVAIVVAAVTVYGLARWAQPGTSLSSFVFRLAEPSYYPKAYFALGFLWPLTLAGLWLVRTSRLGRLLLPYFACTLAGSLVSTLFAADVTRMFLSILPVSAVACAVVFDRLWGRRQILLAWLGVTIANLGIALPNALVPGSGEHLDELEGWYLRLPALILTHQLAGLLLVALSTRAVSVVGAATGRQS